MENLLVFPVRYMLECHLFLQSCFSAGCTKSLDSFGWIVDPDSLRSSGQLAH